MTLHYNKNQWGKNNELKDSLTLYKQSIVEKTNEKSQLDFFILF